MKKSPVRRRLGSRHVTAFYHTAERYVGVDAEKPRYIYAVERLEKASLFLLYGVVVFSRYTCVPSLTFYAIIFSFAFMYILARGASRGLSLKPT